MVYAPKNDLKMEDNKVQGFQLTINNATAVVDFTPMGLEFKFYKNAEHGDLTDDDEIDLTLRAREVYQDIRRARETFERIEAVIEARDEITGTMPCGRWVTLDMETGEMTIREEPREKGVWPSLYFQILPALRH